MDLFDYMRQTNQEKEAPLAARLRPRTLDEVVGQQHIIGKDKLLYRAIQADKLSSIIFYGPPGTGKTTLARVIANTTSAEFMQINATVAGKKDMEEVVAKAKDNRGMFGKKTILFIDEIHRFNKSQQDYLLPFVEDGTLILIGATTENPYFEVNGALLSRSVIFELKPLSKEDIEELKKKRIVFVAGGVGTAPVYPQLKWLHEHGITADAIVGAKTKDLVILEKEMSAVSNLYITTDDGSYVRKGMGTDVLRDLVQNQGKQYDVCVAIGPMIMMKFVCLLTKELNIPTVVSMNPIMVDGTGMCGACRLMVGNEVKFACVDGPEFDGHLVDFDLAMKRQQMYKTEEGRALLRYQEGATHHGGCGQCGGDK